MTSKNRVDVLRVLQDESYATRLSDKQWEELAANPLLYDLTADEPELLQALYHRTGRQFPGSTGSGANPSLAVEKFSTIGTRQPRIQGVAIVGGTGRYLEHVVLPDMLYMKVLRSPHPHARVKKIDSNTSGGPPPIYIFPEEVYQAGTPVAMLAAEKQSIADQAIRLIEVEYENLPASIDLIEATRPTTAKQWNSQLDGTILAKPNPFVRGKGADALSEADVVVESTTYHPFFQHV